MCLHLRALGGSWPGSCGWWGRAAGGGGPQPVSLRAGAGAVFTLLWPWEGPQQVGCGAEVVKPFLQLLCDQRTLAGPWGCWAQRYSHWEGERRTPTKGLIFQGTKCFRGTQMQFWGDFTTHSPTFVASPGLPASGRLSAGLPGCWVKAWSPYPRAEGSRGEGLLGGGACPLPRP